MKRSTKKSRRYNSVSGTSLALWREKNNLSQEEAAEMLLITQAHFSQLERGVVKPNRRMEKQISDLIATY
jgi:transcriptional regulator with XRE-family HTH domain